VIDGGQTTDPREVNARLEEARRVRAASEREWLRSLVAAALGGARSRPVRGDHPVDEFIASFLWGAGVGRRPL
jgi:hypothetical protein